MNLTDQISEFIVKTRFEDLPEEVVQIAKEFVLDSVGAQLAGSREPVSKIAREYIKENGGTPEAGVIGGGFATSVTHAAFLNGVTAAILAQKGLTAANDILDGRSNLWEVFVGEGGYDPKKMTEGLGSPFYFLSPGSCMKKYPCCFFTHRALDALLQLVNEHNLSYEEIQSVEAGVTPFIKEALVGGADPESGDMARFSLEHCLASAIVDKEVTVQSFTNEKVLSPKLKEARRKVKLTVHPEWPSGRSALVIPVTLKLRGGKELTSRVEKLKGTVDLPMSREEQITRYRGFAKPFLSDPQIEHSIEFILNLEKLKDILELMKTVTFGHEDSITMR